MSDDPITECEVCGQSVKRLLFPVAIHFKGSGFYSTDYAKRSCIGAGNSSNGGAASSQGGSESGSEPAGSTSTDSSNSASADKPAVKASDSSAARTPVAAKSD